MKKIFKMLGLIMLILLFSIVVYYLYLTDFGRKSTFSPNPERPKLEIPVTYNIGWWSYQEALSIDSLNIEIVERKLNLFNGKSIISYKVSGLLNYEGSWQPRVNYEGYWQPYIKEVHISERLNSDAPLYYDGIAEITPLHFDRVIEITPIIGVKRNKGANDGSEKFEFKNEHIINSSQWGINRIKFVCGQKEQIIELYQGK
jgi:hypothetical protein